jgi:hypothetical protein
VPARYDVTRLKLFDAEVTTRRIAIAALIAIVLSLPSLATGFFADDYIHLMALGGYDAGSTRPYDLYRFIDGDAQRFPELVRTGPWVWWGEPSLRCAFWRPVPSALANLDYRLFGLWGPGWHAHSILWYGALCAAVGVLYRRVFRHPTAFLALLMFAIDDAHAFSAAWTASRYVIIAAVFSTVALWAYWRAREESWRPGIALAAGCYALSLTCGESALCLTCYLFAYELFARETAARRLRALAPFAGVTLVYLVIHHLGGYGTTGSGVYIDPIHEPVRFVAAMPARIATLLGGLFGGTPVDFWLMVRESHRPLAIAGALMAVPFALMLRATLRAASQGERRTLSWLAAGAVLALVPSLGAPMGTRLLTYPSIGAFPVIAAVLVHAWRAGGVARIGAGWLVAMHVVLAPIGFMSQFKLVAERSRSSLGTMARFASTRPSGRFALIRGTDPFVGVYGAAALVIEHRVNFESWNLLSLTQHPLRIRRSGERTLDVEVEGGQLLDTPFEQVWRNGGPPVGYRVSTAMFTLTITGVENGLPKRFTVELADAPGTPGATLLVETADGLVPFVPPPLGESVTLPPGPGPFDPPHPNVTSDS